MSSYVVVSRAEAMDFQKEYVCLPSSYGTPAYAARADVQEIRRVVFQNLSELDRHTGFLDRLRGRKVIIKPNLVMVEHKVGFIRDQYPNNTDPRVLDAIVEFLQPHAGPIVIAESSGRGMPTRASFKIAGLDRLARRRGLELVPLEEQPVERYILPKARVMQEIYIPRLYTEIVEGQAFYISVPKLKTNPFTVVTLGFKNAMGTIPYNLRQRNHNYLIDEKLVDMLYLFRPDLVIIDGIVGGEGNTPGPIDPVDSRVIVSGDNSVETDRVATRIMGHDPDEVKLIRHATSLGFGDPQVRVIGQEPRIPFRPADRSLFTARFRERFPQVRVLVGHMKNQAPKVAEPGPIAPETVREMERACLGGCVPSVNVIFETIAHLGQPTDFEAVLVIGAGVEIGGGRFYYDADGIPYDAAAIAALPGYKLAMGSCSQWLRSYVDEHIPGCMPSPQDSPMIIIRGLGLRNSLLSPLKNRQLLRMLIGTLQQVHARKRLIRKGVWIDCPLDERDRFFETRPLTPEERAQDYIPWPLPPMTRAQQKAFLKQERLAAF